MEKLKNKFVRRVIMAVIILVLGTTGIGIAYAHNNVNSRLEQQLALGDSYLENLDYERAIAAYEEALEIDDKCVEAYLGIAAAYCGLEDYEKAIAMLELGIEKTDSEELKARLEEIKALLEEQKAEEKETSSEESKTQENPAGINRTESATEEMEETDTEEEPDEKKQNPKKTQQTKKPEETSGGNMGSVPEPKENADSGQQESAQQPPADNGNALPERETQIQQISFSQQVLYNGEPLAGTRIEASLCDYDGNIEPVILGSTETGKYTYSGECDVNNQYIRLKIDLPEGYYFCKDLVTGDYGIFYNYNEQYGLYGGRVCDVNVKQHINLTEDGTMSFYVYATNPAVDGSIVAEPGVISLKVGDCIDLNSIRLIHTSADGVVSDVQSTSNYWMPEFFCPDGSKYVAVKAGNALFSMWYHNCVVNIPVTIEESETAWIDGLYENLVNGNYQEVLAIIRNSDFIEKCKPYEDTDIFLWMDNTGYRLPTSDGKMVGVILYEGGSIDVFYVQNADYEFECINYGDFNFFVSSDGSYYDWFDGTTLHFSDGSSNVFHEGELVGVLCT